MGVRVCCVFGCGVLYARRFVTELMNKVEFARLDRIVLR